MKKHYFVLIIILLFFTCACSSDKEEKVTVIDYRSIKITKKHYANLKEAGKITKVVKLETNEDSLLGRIGRVEVDIQTGDLVVGDFRNTKRVLRFTSEGKYVCRYGKRGEGPGEYRQLLNFTVTGIGDVILLDNAKLLKFSRAGKLLLESRLNYFVSHIESIDDLLFIHILRYRSNPDEKKAVLILNSNFEQVGGIGNYDNRLEKMIFGVWGSLSKKDKLLYYIDHYNFTLSIYNSKTKQLSRLTIPSENSSSEGIWSKQKLSQEDEDSISTNLHRFILIKSFNKSLFLLEFHIKTNTFNAWLLNLESKQALVFNKSCLTGNSQVKEKKDLFFYNFPGSYKKGIIGVFNDDQAFNLHKSQYPMLKDIHFNADDNPILAFFEFHK